MAAQLVTNGVVSGNIKPLQDILFDLADGNDKRLDSLKESGSGKDLDTYIREVVSQWASG
jgi:hypothetical protein